MNTVPPPAVQVPLADLDAMTDRQLLVSVAVSVGDHGLRIEQLERKLKTSAVLLAVIVTIGTTLVPEARALVEVIEVALQ